MIAGRDRLQRTIDELVAAKEICRDDAEGWASKYKFAMRKELERGRAEIREFVDGLDRK